MGKERKGDVKRGQEIMGERRERDCKGGERKIKGKGRGEG